MKKFKSKNVLGRLSAAALSLSLLSAATSCGKAQQQQGNNTSSKPGRIMVIGKADLEAAGVEILSCGTCLDFFHAKEKLRAGRVSNMMEIAESLWAADRVLRP